MIQELQIQLVEMIISNHISYNINIANNIIMNI